MALLGEHIPELAQKLGLDVSKLKRDANLDGTLAVVTFQEPNYETGGRRDPIARLPPSYSRYGIVDRDHRDRVESGQTWFVQSYTPQGSQAVFLIPVLEVDLASLLALDNDVQKALAQDLVAHRPDLVKALGDLLPSEPKADPEEVARLRGALAEAEAALSNAATALGKARASTLQVLEEAADDVARAASALSRVPPPKAAESVPVKLVRKKKDTGPTPIFLADANLFINAERWKWEDCNRILDAAGGRFRLATTRRVHDELHHSYRLPKQLMVIEAGDIDPKLVELADANASALGKKAGENDLSLIQAVLENEDIRGIITEDPDILNMHPPSLVKKLVERDIECVSASEFVERHKKLVKA